MSYLCILHNQECIVDYRIRCLTPLSFCIRRTFPFNKSQRKWCTLRFLFRVFSLLYNTNISQLLRIYFSCVATIPSRPSTRLKTSYVRFFSIINSIMMLLLFNVCRFLCQGVRPSFDIVVSLMLIVLHK